MRFRVLACLLVAMTCGATPVVAQTQSAFSNLTNPAIGLNALISARAARSLDQPYGMQFDEAELSLISVVDPYWTLSANIAFTSEEVDAEEVWARTTNIPSVGLMLGKVRATFGKHGLLHPHAFPFVEAPIIMDNSIGEEGFKSPGLEAAWLTPLPWYAELTGGAYGAEEVSDENPLDFGSTRHDNVPILGHLANLVDLNDATTLEVGASALRGWGSDGAVRTVLGADLTVRNVPARNSNRRGWILQGEWIEKGARMNGARSTESAGGYASLQLRLSQVWWVGVRGEHNRDCYADFLVDTAGDPVPGRITRGSVNVAWSPSEFSYVRLEYSHAQADAGGGIEPNDDRVALQLSYTIGHHPAHAY